MAVVVVVVVVVSKLLTVVSVAIFSFLLLSYVDVLLSSSCQNYTVVAVLIACEGRQARDAPPANTISPDNLFSRANHYSLVREGGLVGFPPAPGGKRGVGGVSPHIRNSSFTIYEKGYRGGVPPQQALEGRKARAPSLP